MQIVINVREDFLYEIKHKHPNMRTELEQSVLDGTILPKGHGRLIDADALMEYCQNDVNKTVDCNDIARFPTIIGGEK